MFQVCSFIICALFTESSMLSLPSRTLPQRAWAASVPTLLSQDALSKLLTPVAVVTSQLCCPLERFLASVFLRRHLQRIMQTADNVCIVQFLSSLLLFIFTRFDAVIPVDRTQSIDYWLQYGHCLCLIEVNDLPAVSYALKFMCFFFCLTRGNWSGQQHDSTLSTLACTKL